MFSRLCEVEKLKKYIKELEEKVDNMKCCFNCSYAESTQEREPCKSCFKIGEKVFRKWKYFLD
jgi:hypothetical protein